MSDNIILVGNGPSVLHASLGPVIDQFEHIVRFNGYQLSGYAEHVGTRTTIWSRWYALPTMQPMDSLAQIWINMPIHERTTEKLQLAKEMLGKHQAKSEVIPSIRVAIEVQKSLFGGPHPTKWPSSGLLAIAHALDLGMQISLVGFDSWSTEPFHYYEAHDRTHSHHVATAERQYIRDLVQRGAVKHLRA